MSLSKGYVDADYLDLAARVMGPLKRRTYELLQLRPGQRVLDLGCGPGIDTIALSESVGPAGEDHGVDHDATMVDEANRRAEAAGLAARVSHRQADASALPWSDGFFDASRSERVLQHLLDSEKAFAEMVRVTRSGGRVVVLDGDWATFTIASDEIELERRLVRFHAERMINNPYSGRKLGGMFKSLGLQDVHVEGQPVIVTDYALARRVSRLDEIEQEALKAGVFDESDSLHWRASLQRAAALGGFFSSVNGVTVSGRKQ